MSERTDIQCDCCGAPAGQRCAEDCQSRDDGPATFEEHALMRRIAHLESELERIRPVYDAACKWRDGPTHEAATALVDSVDAARSPR